MLAPLISVLLFLAAIISAFWYLRNEEIERETESVKRDVEITQQQIAPAPAGEPGAVDAHRARAGRARDRRRRDSSAGPIELTREQPEITQ